MSRAGLIGRIAVQEGMITREQLRRATREQGRHPDKRLGEVLVDLGYIDEGQLGALLAAQARASDSVRPPRRNTPPPVKKAVPDGVKLGAIALKRVSANQFAGETQKADDEARRKEGAEARGWLLGLLSDANTTGASDVLMLPNQPVRLRRFGRVHDFTTGPVSASGTQRLLQQTLDDQQRATLEREGHVTVFFEAPSVGRYRLQVHREAGGMGGVFHRLTPHAASGSRDRQGESLLRFDELGLPNWLAGLTNFPHGLILVTGSTGSGRSTTLSAMVHLIGEERSDHIVVVETPREHRPSGGDALITQLEVGTHATSVESAIVAAPHMDADVICVDELPAGAVDAALQAADGSRLVIATMRASSSANALERLIDSYPEAEAQRARALVSDVVRAVVNQRLVPALGRDGEEVGAVLALEVVHVDDEVRALIRGGDLGQLSGLISSGRSRGSKLLDDALAELVRTGRTSADAARAVARHPAKFTSRDRA